MPPLYGNLIASNKTVPSGLSEPFMAANVGGTTGNYCPSLV